MANSSCHPTVPVKSGLDSTYFYSTVTGLHPFMAIHRIRLAVFFPIFPSTAIFVAGKYVPSPSSVLEYGLMSPLGFLAVAERGMDSKAFMQRT